MFLIVFYFFSPKQAFGALVGTATYAGIGGAIGGFAGLVGTVLGAPVTVPVAGAAAGVYAGVAVGLWIFVGLICYLFRLF